MRWPVLAGLLALCYAVALASGLLVTTSVDTWYPNLAKPGFTPPSWLFPPVWWTLYTLMAIAAWRVWRAAGSFETAQQALVLFFVQLAFNLEWSFLFFGMQMIGWALLDSVVLWCLILLTTLAFFRRDRIAAVLMLPYLGWVGYATALNAAIWRLN